MLTGTAVYRQMFGEAFGMSTSPKARDHAPVDRLLLYPHRMKVVADSDGKGIGCVYTTPMVLRYWATPRSDHPLKMFNPSNHMRCRASTKGWHLLMLMRAQHG